MKRIICLLLTLCLFCCAGCGDSIANAADVAGLTEIASLMLEQAGYRVNFVSDTTYLAQIHTSMNDSGNVSIEKPLAAYLEATNTISGGDDAIEIYAFTSLNDANEVAEYLISVYLEQKYQVYQIDYLVCLGTIEALEVIK